MLSVIGARAPGRSGPSARVAVLDGNPILGEAMCRHVGSSRYFDRGDVVSLTWSQAGELDSIRPSIVVLDPAEPPEGLDTFVAALRARMPDMALVAYASEPSLPMARTCMGHGFRAFLPKSADGAQVTAALTAVANGGMYVDRRFAECLLPAAGAEEAGTAGPTGALSAREEAILRRIAQGVSHKTIAKEFGLSPKTVDTYRARGMRKLALADRSELIRHARERGWLD